MICGCRYGYKRESMVMSNIFKNPSFLSALDWRLDTFSLRRSRTLLLSKDSRGYHGNIRRLTIVAQQTLKGNKEQM